MDKNYNIIGPKLAVTRVTNTRKMMLVIDTGTLGIKLDLNFRKNNFQILTTKSILDWQVNYNCRSNKTVGHFSHPFKNLNN